jgi:hypothetical protein
MTHKVQYGVKFVGYSAEVIRKGCEVAYAKLDFVTGHASVHTDQGWVSSKRTDLGPFVQNLPKLATELQQRLSLRSDGELKEIALSSEMVTLLYGEDKIFAAPDTNVKKFIRQITKRFIEVEQVLEQAELVGSRIKRRPYADIDEIEKTGLCRVEAHGFGLFFGGKLMFYPGYQVALVKPTRRPDTFELHMLDQNRDKGSQPN